MGSGLEDILARSGNLLFVTTTDAVTRLAAEPATSDAVYALRANNFKRWVEFETPLRSCYAAVPRVRQALQNNAEVDGVVILGNYAEVPPRRILSIDPGLYARLNKTLSNAENDDDKWWVWNDDIYGHVKGDYKPELPVSRMPIIPRSSANALDVAGVAPGSKARGLRATEFPFADHIYKRHLGNPAADMDFSPPRAQAPPIGGGASIAGLAPGTLDADRLYLVLHNDGSVALEFYGTSDVGWSPVAINHSVVAGQWVTTGVAFGAICWGALMSTRSARWVEPGDTIVARKIGQSLPLVFVDHGANAFVGFTALHYVPVPYLDPTDNTTEITDDLRIGGQLHDNFWAIVKTPGIRPANALFLARDKFLQEMPAEGDDPLGRAKNMKAFWSATCIGFGW